MHRSLASVLIAGLSCSSLVACSSSDGSSSSSSGSGASGASGASGGAGGEAGGSDAGGAGGSGGGAPSWHQAGLDGSAIPYLAVHQQEPSTILIGTSPAGNSVGYFRSTDGGDTWPQAPDLPADQWANGLAASRLEDVLLANPGVLGMKRSTDGGESWADTIVSVGAPAGIAFHPTQPGKVWLTDGNLGVFASADSGANWAATANMGLPLGQEGIGAIVSDGVTLYVAAGAQGVFASTDGGASFTAANNGLPLGIIQGVPNTLAAHPSRPGLVLAQTTAEGLYRTDDSGNTWAKVDLGSDTTRYTALAIDPVNPTTFYVSHDDIGDGPGGLLRSTDDGKTWSNIGPDGVDVLVVDFDPQSARLYAGTLGSGVWIFE